MKPFIRIFGTIFKVFMSAAVLVAALATITLAQSQYTFTDLGPGYASGINDSGQVVGALGGSDAGVWSNGAVISLPPLPGDGGAFAQSINNSGQVVGYSCSSSIDGSNVRHAALWSNGTVTELGPLPGGATESQAQSINNSGQVVGYSYNTSGSVFPEATLWSNGAVTDLGNLGGTPASSYAYSINNFGQAVGKDNGSWHAVLFSNGRVTDLSLPGGNGCVANSINDSGQAVGAECGDIHAVLFSNGTVTDLGTLPGDAVSEAMSINNSGQVVGFSSSNTLSRAVIFSNGAATDLNSLVNAPGWVLSTASGINSAGQIVGNGTLNGQTHAVLLTPINMTSETFTDTVSSSGNGTITSSSSTVNYAGSVAFTITPSAGYTLTSLTDNGTNVTGNAVWNASQGVFTYTISDVTSNNTIQATFGTLPPASAAPALSPQAFCVLVIGLGLVVFIARKRNKISG